MLRKFIAIGDVHADWDTLWQALRAANCLGADGLPTPPVRTGTYQVVLIGDLVHPKSAAGYARLTGLDPFDPRDAEHLRRAVHAQVGPLEQLRAYQQAAPHAVHIVLGNHDAAALDPQFLLGTGAGLTHPEFDPAHGGWPLPPQLQAWISGFPREVRVGGVQFAHVSPLPQHSHYDDLFYSDRSSKTWFRDTPEYVAMAGLAFGVYGHTPVEGGVQVHRDERGRPSFALIDALHEREYLEVLWDDGEPQTVRGVASIPF